MLSAVLVGFVGRQVGMPRVLTVRCCVIYKGVGLHSYLSWIRGACWLQVGFVYYVIGFCFLFLSPGLPSVAQAGL